MALTDWDASEQHRGYLTKPHSMGRPAKGGLNRTGHMYGMFKLNDIYDGSIAGPERSTSYGSGSLLLDGNSDYIGIVDGDRWDLSAASAWTWELFFYPLGTSDNMGLMHFSNTGGNSSYTTIRINSNQALAFESTKQSGGPYDFAGANSSAIINRWNHVRITYDGSNVRVWLNGIHYAYGGGANITAPSNGTDGMTVRIGTYGDASSNPGASFNGYIDEVRILKGKAASTGSGNIAVPNKEFVPDKYTVLLLHMDGANGATSVKDHSWYNTSINFFGTAHIRAETGLF